MYRDDDPAYEELKRILKERSVQDKDPAHEELKRTLKEGSKKVIERFGQAATSGLTHPKLLLMMEEVKGYWKDFLRPALTSYSCEAVGGQPAIAEDAGLAITLAAAGMGVHDDIIDRSMKKHFRDTIFGLHSLEDALLVGDILIIKGLITAWKLLGETCQPKKTADVIDALESFIFELYEAELREISYRKNLDTKVEERVENLWKITTDAEACARIGAILGDGAKDEVQALAEFGRRFGFVMHLGEEMKDCLNIEGNLPHRLKYESLPLPILYAAKSSKEIKSEIETIIGKSSITGSDVRRLLEVCFETEALTYVYNIAKKNVIAAERKLELLVPSSARDALALMLKVSFADIENLCR